MSENEIHYHKRELSQIAESKEKMFIHVINLEKYHPSYKDRTLVWAKIYFNMIQGDPDCEMIESETDVSIL